MVATDADDDAEMRRAHPEGSGRKPREQGLGASIATARPQPSPPEVEVRLSRRSPGAPRHDPRDERRELPSKSCLDRKRGPGRPPVNATPNELEKAVIDAGDAA